ncbi:MAG: FTR1 family protein [Candidatus Diapherotrites archaeon]|nr:FTR1 family protein [Candidatus Diapherotrites archaeon]
MIPEFIIGFRESLEAALIAGIILSYLAKTGQEKYNRIIYLGIIAGVVASLAGAFLFAALAGGFQGTAEQLFEGITMLIGAALLTTMILWMMKQKHVALELQHKVSERISQAQKFGLFFLAFIAILREGIETVIFLGAAGFVSQDNGFIGALAGIALAVVLGYLLFVNSKKINIKKFFKITSILLVLFAAGLVAHAIHEFEEAGVLNPIIEHVWDINPAQNSDGSYPLLHENGAVGSIFKGLLGYNGNPSLLEVLSYFAYLILVFALWKNIERIHKKVI